MRAASQLRCMVFRLKISVMAMTCKNKKEKKKLFLEKSLIKNAIENRPQLLL